MFVVWSLTWAGEMWYLCLKSFYMVADDVGISLLCSLHICLFGVVKLCLFYLGLLSYNKMPLCWCWRFAGTAFVRRLSGLLLATMWQAFNILIFPLSFHLLCEKKLTTLMSPRLTVFYFLPSKFCDLQESFTKNNIMNSALYVKSLKVCFYNWDSYSSESHF